MRPAGSPRSPFPVSPFSVIDIAYFPYTCSKTVLFQVPSSVVRALTTCSRTEEVAWTSRQRGLSQCVANLTRSAFKALTVYRIASLRPEPVCRRSQVHAQGKNKTCSTGPQVRPRSLLTANPAYHIFYGHPLPPGLLFHGHRHSMLRNPNAYIARSLGTYTSSSFLLPVLHQ